ncbi:MAG: DNA mismatch repair endonuclease MutL [Anaerolineae bacterium]|nr:DNA mismatch repair endonuclease MutL [Anaerolineae bacterium]
MSVIHVLPPQVAASIAAGEVIERPASVVKELVENALDAGAAAISVEIAGGGLSLVRVSDNGCGMSRADVPLALERFSTSKIRTLADLSALRTLGFRGEALAAIAAVARLTILARTAAELEGTRVTARYGQVAVEPAASPAGCSVAVSDLFYNTPARRKFLKSPLREAELCQETVTRYALAYPEVAFKLTADGRERLVAPPATALERLGLALGREAAAEMLPIAWEAGDLRVGGYASSPAVGRSRRDGQYFYLNRRPIRSGLLAVMLERPYAGRLPPGRSPLAVVYLELDPALVDINVHPRKAEVRFAQERAVYQALSQAVSAALSPFPVQEMWGTPGWPFPETPTAPAAMAEGIVAYEVAQKVETMGQVRNTYIVARAFDELIIVDQHAAHEAVLTERLLAGEEPVRLSPPARIDLTPREAELLAGYLGVLADLGLEVEPFGANSFLLRALPASLAGQDAPSLLAGLLAELAANRDLDPDALREKLASRAACHAAVKAGDRLSLEQQQALLDELLAAWSPATCPHGRPALFRLTVEEIERRFLRR